MTTPTPWTCWKNPEHATGLNDTFGWPTCRVCGAGPTYPERFEMLDPQRELGVYVPANEPNIPGGPIAARSAIVGLHIEGTDRVLIYFEGWVNGTAQYGDLDPRGLWQAGVKHAAGRMVVDYPTTAKGMSRLEALTRVGTYWAKTDRIEVTDDAAINAWLETDGTTSA